MIIEIAPYCAKMANFKKLFEFGYWELLLMIPAFAGRQV
jgi:hypothetical protein